MTGAPAPITPIVLRSISQRFGRKVVLRGVDLELRAGSITGLVGANGAGKTTLFLILAGLLQPDGGERRFGGREVGDVDLELRARLAFVAHAPQLYPGLSARANLELFAELRRAAGLSSRPADDVLRGLGLPVDALDRPVSTFSRGMAQRVALARAVAGDPELLLLDEPFTALDARGRSQLAGALLAERDRGTAILLSSHDQGTLLRVCDRLVLLEAGAIVREVERGGDDPAAFAVRAAAVLDAVGPDDHAA
ncbi:ABC transporter ATP-binding protein [Nannocystis radixulma]|uniref:ABC transporter ATP-binding protein n=1 Tax=Nannocystis radixulma TaxID=2995305 RepID=A0ABT5BBU9_9BACT|nr:ABC transporter ATP-binding protein [Nannocystis radixulma]MDC0671009.1 ABC transporter ATP-binding protein [Nannocystis radixulma]